MNAARTSVTLANIEIRDLGNFNLQEALVAFDTFPWAEELQRAERLDAEGQDCVSPDMTFTRQPFHFTVTVQDATPTLDLELCVPRKGKLLGLVAMQSTKFFEFEKISRATLERLLRAFFTIPPEEQLEFFSKFDRT